MKKDIPKLIDALCERYDSRDPYEIAGQLGIIVQREPLGAIRGYYNREYGFQMIHINSDLSTGEQRMVCSHELGHAIIHPDANTPFLRTQTFYSVDKMEIEANRFMIYMEVSEDELAECGEYPMAFLADIYGVPIDLIKWRYDQIQTEIHGEWT